MEYTELPHRHGNDRDLSRLEHCMQEAESFQAVAGLCRLLLHLFGSRPSSCCQRFRKSRQALLLRCLLGRKLRRLFAAVGEKFQLLYGFFVKFQYRLDAAAIFSLQFIKKLQALLNAFQLLWVSLLLFRLALQFPRAVLHGSIAIRQCIRQGRQSRIIFRRFL